MFRNYFWKGWLICLIYLNIGNWTICVHPLKLYQTKIETHLNRSCWQTIHQSDGSRPVGQIRQITKISLLEKNFGNPQLANHARGDLRYEGWNMIRCKGMISYDSKGVSMDMIITKLAIVPYVFRCFYEITNVILSNIF